MSQQLPRMSLTGWNTTRDTLHQYARIIGKIRGRYMPKSKHWWNITLSVSARGLTTTPFPIAEQNLELRLDLAAHQLAIESSDGLPGKLRLGYATRSASRLLQSASSWSGISWLPSMVKKFCPTTSRQSPASAKS